MKIQELMKILFPTQHKAWMTLLEITDQLKYFQGKDLSGVELVDLLNARLQDKATGWLRAAGKERWEVNNQFTPSKNKIISKAVNQIGLYQDITPQKTEYDCAFLMGATAWTVKARMDNAINLYNQGKLKLKRLYVMAGWRELSPAPESGIMKVLQEKNIRLNEIEMMEYLVSKTASESDFFKEIEIIYVNASSIEGSKRATTTDNFICWKEHHHGIKNDKTVLILTNQPYVHYQCAVALQILSDNFTKSVLSINEKETHAIIGHDLEIEAIGPHSDPKAYPDIGLDSLGRFVYASKERWKKLPALQETEKFHFFKPIRFLNPNDNKNLSKKQDIELNIDEKRKFHFFHQNKN